MNRSDRSSTSVFRRLLVHVACAAALAAGVAHAAVPLPSGAAGSAGETELAENLSREDVQALLSRLSDQQVRELLMRELDKKVATASDGAGTYLERFQAGLRRLRDNLVIAYASRGELAGLPAAIWSRVTAGGVHSFGAILLGLALSLVAAMLVERIVRRLMVGAGGAESRAVLTAGASRLGIIAVWLLRELLLVTVFVLVAVAAAWVALAGRESAEPLFWVVIAIIAILRVVSIAVEIVVSTRDPATRQVPLTDAGARSLKWAVMLVVGLLMLNQGAKALNNAYGTSEGATALVGVVTSLVMVLALCALLWRARAHFSEIILGDIENAAPGDAAFRRALAASWPGMSIAYVLGVWLLATGVAFATGVSVLFPALTSLALVLALPLADAMLRRVVEGAFTPQSKPGNVELSVGADGEAVQSDAMPVRGADYRQLILRYLRVLVVILIVAAFLALWDIEIGAFAESLVGTRVARALFDIGVTVLLAYAIWGIVKAAVEYHVGPEKGQKAEAHGEGEGGGPGASRLQTLLPLFRKVVLISILVIGVMISLSALGVNIGPILAGAGIVGIAIGFGAQTLVRDIVSGVFFLIDDAFRMGEYVEIDDIRGRVEAISVRSLRLRHHNGPLHTVPFGEIKHLTNYSRDWAIMKFELRVPYETDLDKVRKIIKRIGQEMMNDEELGPLLLGPLKSQGVNRMDDSALIIRCKFTALPGQQFYVRREAFSRIQKAFEEAGIQFAPRRVIVQAQTPALASAAAGALDAEAQKKATAKSDDRG